VRHAYPLLLDVTDRLVVIIGGGGVATRKAEGLLEAGATRIRVVGPSFAMQAPEIDFLKETYEPRHLDGAGLVFAATDSAEVNNAVLHDARTRGILACRADASEDEPGDFVTPAKLTRGPVIVTVSAGSAALSSAVRAGIAERFDHRWEAMADAMRTLRPLVRSAVGLNQARRADVFRTLASAEALSIMSDGGIDALLEWIAARYPEIQRG
jgi:precorrin-2 dehydrogenase / sirohydrochlorin ferrochelatase